MYRPHARTGPTNVTAPQWTNALWSRLEQMIEEMAGCCIKVGCYDPHTPHVFLRPILKPPGPRLFMLWDAR